MEPHKLFDVFMGGLGLSRLLVNTEDITILILVHIFSLFSILHFHQKGEHIIEHINTQV